MAEHGGKRENAGRKTKAEEQKLVEKLSPLEPTAIRVLEQAVRSGERWAVDLFFKYFYGLPKQTIDQTIKSEDVQITIVKPKDDKGKLSD